MHGHLHLLGYTCGKIEHPDKFHPFFKNSIFVDGYTSQKNDLINKLVGTTPAPVVTTQAPPQTTTAPTPGNPRKQVTESDNTRLNRKITESQALLTIPRSSPFLHYRLVFSLETTNIGNTGNQNVSVVLVTCISNID